MIYLVILPEIISLSLLFIFILILKSFKSYTIKETRKTILYLTLPKIIDMLEKIGLSESFLDSVNYKPNTFLRILRVYLITKGEKKLTMMFNSVKCDNQPYIENSFGLVLGTFLTCMQANPMILKENFNYVSGFVYEYNSLKKALHNKSYVDSYYIWFFQYPLFNSGSSHLLVFTYAFNVKFASSLQTMVEEIYNFYNRNTKLDKTKGNDGVRFSKYLILFFTTEIDANIFKSFIKSEKRAYGSEFELIFVGANKPEDLEFRILEKEDNFLTEDDYFLYNFIVLKNLNYKPLSDEEKVKVTEDPNENQIKIKKINIE